MNLPDYTMSEPAWLSCIRPYGPLEFVKRRASDRQLRLFSCACCRRIWSLIDQQLYRDAVEVAEQYADQLIIGKVRKSLSKRVRVDYKQSWSRPQANRKAGYAALMCLQKNIAWHPVSQEAAVWAVCATASESERDATEAAEYAAQVVLLRDIFGPLPFRPMIASPRWLTSGVVTLAQQMYDSRDFAPMSLLANALEEAGCANADVLAHCRGPGPHVRGCFAIDLILGKN